MLKRKLLGTLIGIAVMAAAPAAVSELTGMPVLYASAAEVVSASDFTVTPNSDGTTAVLSAYTGTATDIEIPGTVTVDDVPYTVTGIGDNTFKSKTKITNVVIPDSVTSIGSSAFYGCSGLTSVTLPSGITAIPEKAFYGCSKLESITIPNSVDTLGAYAFYNCKALTSIKIPDGVAVIPSYAFYGTGLTSVTIPSSVKNININAFANCQSLVNVYVPDPSEVNGYITIASSAFSNCPVLDFSYFTYDLVENGNASITGIIGQQTNIILPNKIAGCDVVTTGEGAFQSKTFIKSVVIPEGIRTLGEKTFYKCTGLESVTIPSTLSTISVSAFEGCTSLKVAPLVDPNPNDDCNIEIVEIGNRAFYGCTSLSDVQFSGNLNKIGTNAFFGCTAIQTINMPNNIRTLGDGVFQGCTGLKTVQLSNSLRTIPKAAFHGCSALTSIVIPDDVTEIADGSDKYGAFQSSGLTSVTLPDRLEKIGAFAFKETPLTSVTMYNNVNTLGKSCFEACSNLSSLTLSEGLTSIAERAFADCTSLATVKIPEKVTSIMKEAFSCYNVTSDDGYGNLSSVTLPKNLTTIGENAFAGHTPLKSIELSNTITTIGAGAFRWTGLTKVVLPTNAKYTTLNKAVFSECLYLADVTIPENVTMIGDGGSKIYDGTFNSCISLTSIKLPSKLTKIGSCAFAHCINLGATVIPDSVTSVGDFAFYDCRTMDSITIGKAVKTIGSCAFEHCLALTEMNIPSAVTTVGAGAFSACENLTKLITNANIVNKNASSTGSFYEILFYTDSDVCLDTFYGGDQNLVNHALEEIVFNTGVTEIGDYSFGGASKLKRITIADTVTRIGKEAFYNCKALVFVNAIPKNVTEIADYAFSGCPNLKAIVIPKTVTAIGYKAFAGDTNLTIFGETGSAAETYANNDNEDIPFVNIYQNITNAKAAVVSNAVSLTWDKISDTIVANGQTYKIDKIVYHIYRTGSDGVKTKIADVEANSYTDTAVTLGSTYTYSINCTYCFTAKNGEEYTIDASEVNIGTVTVVAPKVKNVKTVPGDGQVALTWDAVPGATKYAIYTYLNGTFTGAGQTTGTSFTVKNLTNGTKYGFLVTAYVGSSWTKFTTADIVYATPVVSLKPVFKVTPGDAQATVTWNAVSGATKYAVFTYLDGKFTAAGQTVGTSFTVKNLINGTKYGFLVTAYVNSAWTTFTASDIVYATPVASVKPVFKVTPGDGQAVVTWSAVPGATKYAIYTYLDGRFSGAGQTAGTSFTVKNLTNSTKYGFLVTAYIGSAWTTFTASDIVYATPVAAVKPVFKVTPGDGQAVVTWSAVSGATKYAVFTYLDGKFSGAGQTTGTSFTVKNLTNSTKYGFLVTAYVNSAWTTFTASDIVYATPVAAVKPAFKVTPGDGQAVVTWSAVPGATKYAIYTYLDGKFSGAGQTAGTSFTVKDLTNSTKYGFLVTAYVNSAWTTFTSADIVYATPVAAVKPVFSVTPGNGQATITWSAVSGATKYAIYTYLDGKFSGAGQVTGTSFTVTGLNNGTNYGFLVTAYVGSAWTTFTLDDIVYETPNA